LFHVFFFFIVTEWYRGYVTRDKTQNGIFPKSYIHTKDATVSSINDKLAQSLLASQALSYDNTGTATANYTVLASDLNIDFNGTIVIQIILNLSTTAQVKLTPSGSTVSYTAYVNDGNSLYANSIYEFEMNVDNGDAINFVIQVPAGDTLSGLLRVFKRER